MSHRKRFIATILIPTLLIQAGTTMGNTFLPLYARSLGASMGMAALITALMFIGQAAADIPSGWLIHRFGDRKVMIWGMGLGLAALLIRLTFRSTEVLILSILLYGIGSSFIWTSRMSWMKRAIRGSQRGTSMSYVGGSLRMANLAGPLAGGFLAEHWGYGALFSAQAVLSLSALVTVATLMEKSPPAEEAPDYRTSIRAAAKTWREHRGTVIAAALGIGGLTILRASREILFPLWGGELGMGESRIGIVMFAGASVDAALFWLSGLIMTKLGRKVAAVACTTGLAIAIGLLPIAGGMAGLAALSVLAGLGNAMGAGINLTVSGDLAPREAPEFFLSGWRLVMGFAGFGGPALASWMIALIGAAAAPPVVGATGLAGAVILALFMRETKIKDS